MYTVYILYGISIIYELQIYQRVKEMLVLKAAQMKVPLKKKHVYNLPIDFGRWYVNTYI